MFCNFSSSSSTPFPSLHTVMDPAAGEECHSNESGWTYYLCSPMNEDCDDDDVYGHHHHHDSYDGDHHRNINNRHRYDDHNSDDSMASDASTGPRLENPNPTRRNRRNEEDVGGSLSKKAKGQFWEKPVKDETLRISRKEEKAETATTTSAPPHPHHSYRDSDKARKEHRSGKRYSI